MLRKLWRGIVRVVLWDYPRASWQYDVIVALILAFIFLTPRDLFRDQPRPAPVVILEGHAGQDVVWVAPELLRAVPTAQQRSRAKALIEEKLGRKIDVICVDPILDAESEITGYLAQVKR